MPASNSSVIQCDRDLSKEDKVFVFQVGKRLDHEAHWEEEF